MRYQTQIDKTDPQNWRLVSAGTLADAAIEALRKSKPLPSFPCTVYVGRPKPLHDNGTPMIVHAFTIERSTTYGGVK